METYSLRRLTRWLNSSSAFVACSVVRMDARDMHLANLFTCFAFRLHLRMTIDVIRDSTREPLKVEDEVEDALTVPSGPKTRSRAKVLGNAITVLLIRVQPTTTRLKGTAHVSALVAHVE